MSRTEPRLTPWRTTKDLHLLKSLLFPTPATLTTSLTPDTIDKQKRGILKIKSYETRQKLPSCLTATSQLIQLQHRYAHFNGDPQEEEMLKAAISMTVIRFVNGLLDPSQQSQFTIPLSVLAKKVGLPNWFVELRHSSTHKEMSSLEMLGIALDESLEWLYLNYWSKLDEEEKEDEEGEGVEELFREYRRILRNKLSDLKEEDKVEIDRLLERIFGKFEKSEELIIGSLIRFLVKYKFEQGKLLYLNLFEYLFKGKVDIVLRIVRKLVIEKNDDFNNDKYTDKEVRIMDSWVGWIVVNNVKRYNKEEISTLVELLIRYNHVKVLEKINASSDIDESIKARIDANISSKKTNKRKILDDIDSITKDLQDLKKRAVIKPKIFERYENWEPKAFGSV